MEIQLISFNNNKLSNNNDIVQTTLSNPRSLDEFDYNIIDLTSPDIWRNNGNGTFTINCINDFCSIKVMVRNKKTSTVIYVLPNNETFRYYYTNTGRGNRDYTSSKKLKDMLEELCNNILSQIAMTSYSSNYLIFEQTKTKLGDLAYGADFYFDYSFDGIVTKSYKSDKTTTIKLNKNHTYMTTLNIVSSYADLKNFIEVALEEGSKESTPDWFSNIRMFDDNMQIKKIDENKTVIETAETRIKEAEGKLQTNNRYKSILYTNGEELVSVVFDILEKLLSCDLSSFTDEKNEDFLAEVDDKVFIGEIKGVSSNVKNEHITQVEVHYQRYCDLHEEEDIEDKVKAILIINPLRLKKPDERESVHERQIQLAERNGCLIIETSTLLKLFEDFVNEKVIAEDCRKMFFDNSGLLKLE